MTRQKKRASKSHPKQQGQRFQFKDPRPWPYRVDGAAVLDALLAIFAHYLALPPHGAALLALWTAHTYTFDTGAISPILALVSPTKGCGKTTLLDLLSALVRRPLATANISPAGLYRLTGTEQPTLLIDELDSQPCRDDLRNILNAGHRRGGSVVRCVGENFEACTFSVWCPKAIAQIGKPHPTILDRSIVLSMRRKAREDRVAAFRTDRIVDEQLPLRRQLLRWSRDSAPQLREHEPVLPPELFNRVADNWRPLIALADIAGGPWPERARLTAIAFSAAAQIEGDEDFKIELLTDLRQLFAEGGADRLPSEDIIAGLAKRDDRRWGDFNNGDPLRVRQLAKYLKPFGIKPTNIRTDSGVARGYYYSDCVDTFRRWLPDAA